MNPVNGEPELCSSCEIIYNKSCPNCASIMPEYNIFNRHYWQLFNRIIPEKWQYPRSYEGCATYYIVFSPLNNKIDLPNDLQRIEKFCRTNFKYQRFIITREILATRIHYNVMLTSNKNVVLFNGKIKQKFYLDVQVVPNRYEQEKVVHYMLKESKKRQFKENTDYFVYVK